MGSLVKFYLLPSLHFSSDMKVALYFVAVVAVCNAESWLAGPYTLVKRAAEPQRPNLNRNNPSTRFFTGNNAVDAGLAGAAAGAATQYFANQIFNPCTRGGTRNKGTNNRIFGGQTLQNGALGFLAGFAGASLIHNAQGAPCGR